MRGAKQKKMFEMSDLRRREILHLRFVCLSPRLGGGDGTLIFSCMRRLGLFFWVQNFEFQYFLGVFRKLNIFWDMKILWIFFGGNHKIGPYLQVICMHFLVFLKVKVQNGGYYFGC